MTHHHRTTSDPTPARTSAHRRTAGGVAILLGAALALGLTGCGGGTPSKADFIAEVRDTLGDDLNTGEGLSGIDADDLNRIVDDFLGCTYDAVKGDEELLDQLFKDPSFSSATTGSTDASGQLQATLGQLTQDCTTELNQAVAELPSNKD